VFHNIKFETECFNRFAVSDSKRKLQWKPRRIPRNVQYLQSNRTVTATVTS